MEQSQNNEKMNLNVQAPVNIFAVLMGILLLLKVTGNYDLNWLEVFVYPCICSVIWTVFAWLNVVFNVFILAFIQTFAGKKGVGF